MSTDTPTTAPHAPEQDSDDLDEEVETESDRDPATIQTDRDGRRRRVVICLNADDLRRLGISRDVNAVVPSVLNGAVLLNPVN